MGTRSRKSMSRTTLRPARRARRDAAATTTEPAPAAPARPEVEQLAFSYFVEDGFAHGHALDHWLRAESELTRRS
jgi:hypothetical protein